MWLNKLKVALSQKDVESIESLLEEVPAFDNVDDAKTAQYLLKEAMELLLTLQDETKQSLKQMKKNLDFMNATSSPLVAKLDIKS